MKKVYTALFSMLIAGGAMAQFTPNLNPVAKDKTVNYRTGAAAAATSNSGQRVDFYTNDFSDCADWDITTAFDAGFDQFYEDLTWECGTDLEPDGGAPIAPIESTTADNGYMMVDSDGAANNSEIENCWFQSAEPVNCEDHPFVSVNFETYFRCWDSGDSDGNEFCFLEVSNDGTTWPDPTTTGDAPGRYELFPEFQTGDETTNSQLMDVDITELAGGQETVWLRFRWVGTFGYAWFVDDLTFFDTPGNSIRYDGYASYTDVETATIDTGLGYYEYGAIPPGQITEMVFAGTVRNLGSNAQTNTVMDVSINGSSIGATDAGYTLPFGGRDTLRVLGYTPDATEGVYDITYTFSSDSVDVNLDDNTAEQSFEITDCSYGRDNGVIENAFPADGTVEFQGAAPYQFFQDGTIVGIEVAILSDSDANVDLVCHILDFAEFNILESTDEVSFVNPNTNGNDVGDSGSDVNWFYFPLEDGFDVLAGEGYVASIEHSGGNNVQIGESKNTPDQTAFVYGPFGAAQEFDWYFTNEVPMVRFIMEDADCRTVGIDDVEGTNFALLQNRPNPATDVTRIAYELNTSETVALEVRDITGKLVHTEFFGQQAAGVNNITLDVSAFGAGLYTYTLIVEGERLTKKMTVK